MVQHLSTVKRRLSIATLLSLFLFGGGLGIVCGQNSYASSQLEKLSKHIGLTAQTKNGIHYKATTYNGLPITVELRNDEVSHIGLSLFTPWQRQFVDETQCNFLERLALAAEITDFYGIGIRQYLKDEKIEFLEGRLNDLRNYVTDTAFIFQSTLVDDKTYIACWFDATGQERQLTITYPANYHLIAGMTIQEAENRLYNDIRRTKTEDTEQYDPVAELLQPVENGPIRLLKGSICFVPELNSNRYYVEEAKNRFSLLYSEDFPLETFANLATGIEIENQFVINTKLVKYGFHVDEFTMPLKNWLAFCLQKGCTPYFGVISHDEHAVVAEWILKNDALGYCHVMKITLDPSQLKARKGVMQARLNSYVPMSNVKALFDENE